MFVQHRVSIFPPDISLATALEILAAWASRKGTCPRDRITITLREAIATRETHSFKSHVQKGLSTASPSSALWWLRGSTMISQFDDHEICALIPSNSIESSEVPDSKGPTASDDDQIGNELPSSGRCR